MKPYVVVVDGYHLQDGADRGFSSAFRARGVLPVTVMSTPEPLEKFVKKSTWHPDDFEAVHFYDGDFEALLKIVRSYDPIGVVAGNERGVELTAEIVEALFPERGNVRGSAAAQRDKGEMALALERAGVPGPKTLSTDDPAVAARWIEESGLAGRRLIIKPPASAGTDNVHLVEAGADWRGYFDAILGEVNGFDLRNDSVVVQEFLEGPEYIVDLYSVDGRHGLVDTCVYAKHDRGPRIGIYDVADFLGPDHPDVPVLAEYAMRAATAVGIRNGSTHAEVIVTRQGPRLVELAARYSGSCMMLSGSLATGDNQIQRTVRHLLDGAFTPGFVLEQQVRTLWLCADFAGPVHRMDILAAVRDLPTVHKMSVPADGKRVPMTNDVTTSLGWVIQGAAHWADIERDSARIRELERIWNARNIDIIGHDA
ncbi:ATP-grasp domain-containing protein [Streptomyces sp. DvalAA-14]|uniref:ATP-grasp domain-containing protein n=1 Tax=unclassified Streptomyces TaxID=2593676 RepID=UPI00081B94B5|nr:MULTISPECIES: ATP-grasp domain-containing protein [unclassified Streptomyces]MYS19375.1 ATP-grasp domain-containing protein [Streptomyces sp. SID4948]SCD43096.1 ATP-grasp domain-containing protein [Streptomyces sp. DvalAA-14]